MSFVSNHVLWACEQELRAHGVSRDAWRNLAGLPSHPLRDGVLWEDAAELVDAAEVLIGTEGLRSAGRRLVSHPVLARVQAGLPTTSHPDAGTWMLALVLSSVVLPTSHWVVNPVAEGSCLTGSLTPDDVSCPNAFFIVAGAAEVAPTLFGHRPADVALRSTERVASLLIRYAQTPTVSLSSTESSSGELMALATRVMRGLTLELNHARADGVSKRRAIQAYELMLSRSPDTPDSQGRRG